jgi:NADPH2:quinone reductase
MELTDNRGVDVILEMLANVNLGRDLEVLAAHGRVVVIGSRGTVTIDPRLTIGREANILGMYIWGATDKETASLHAALGAGLANGTLNPIVGREFPLAEAPKAHHDIMEKKAYGKIILIP